ncbi:MAG: 3-dehydroquinate synthase [Lentisphaeria bacterium]|nr:3-dehydroquinate synthase [Lentisphaeria bacterium]
MSFSVNVPVALPREPYEIKIGDSFLANQSVDGLQELVEGNHCIIVSDSNVAPIYAEKVTELLLKSGANKTSTLVFEAGEPSKNIHTMIDLYAGAVQAGADRKSFVVALGGGVTGDMAGFLAATFMRGVDYIQMPTSLVAQVDSSVGGKTGIDVPEGKNLVGAFKQPKMVLMDMTMLQTLPKRELICGLAEVIKYGCILDEEFLCFLEEQGEKLLDLDLETYAHIVKRSCELKAMVVTEDELDLLGRRAILNYGHTFGHAIEMLAGFSKLNHGESIAIGMMMAVDLECIRNPSAQMEALRDRQEKLFTQVGLPTRVEGMNPEVICDSMKTDKKYEHGKVRLILPENAGKCVLVKDVSQELILEAIRGRCDE